jgi:thioredoxin-like negative regulator of GroEL
MGERSLRSTTAALLARACLAQGANAEAERFTTVSEELAQPDDLLSQILWRGARARLLASDQQFAAAEHVGAEGVALAAGTDLINVHAEALLDLAWVLQRAGRVADASSLVSRSEALYERKGNEPAVAHIRQLRELSVA